MTADIFRSFILPRLLAVRNNGSPWWSSKRYYYTLHAVSNSWLLNPGELRLRSAHKHSLESRQILVGKRTLELICANIPNFANGSPNYAISVIKKTWRSRPPFPLAVRQLFAPRIQILGRIISACQAVAACVDEGNRGVLQFVTRSRLPINHRIINACGQNRFRNGRVNICFLPNTRKLGSG